MDKTQSERRILVIVRHGQSQWNLENRFTGWKDVSITEQGKMEALQAAEKLKGQPMEVAFTSMLKRAWETLDIIQQSCHWQLPVIKDRALNERSYGTLEGLNKAETAVKYGEEQVHIWRRSYDVAPPGGESLADTAARVIPYYEHTISPVLREGKGVLVVAHGNSLRALMMRLENLTPAGILEVELPTGAPKRYVLDPSLNMISCNFL